MLLPQFGMEGLIFIIFYEIIRDFSSNQMRDQLRKMIKNIRCRKYVVDCSNDNQIYLISLTRKTRDGLGLNVSF